MTKHDGTIGLPPTREAEQIDRELELEAADAPPLEPSVAGKPLHDAKRDPSAAVRLGAPGLDLVAAIAALDLAARRIGEMTSDEGRELAARSLALEAPTIIALCDRALEMIDALEDCQALELAIVKFASEIRDGGGELVESASSGHRYIENTLRALEVTP